MTLEKIPESEKPMWRQLFQNARGRADLKQPAGFATLATLLYCAATDKDMTDALTMTLGAVVMLWWVGDTTEAVAVLMALYGKWRTPDVAIKTEKTQVDSENTSVTNSTTPADIENQEA